MTILPHGTWDTHCHVFPDGFEPAPGKALPAGGGSLDDYRDLCGRLNIAHPVFVQSNAYGLDNSALVHTLDLWGGSARGVAAVAPGTSRDELRRLHEAGVRGARVMNFGGGAVPLSQVLETVAMVRPFGWITIVQFDGSDVAEHMGLLTAIEGDWVLDHFGKFVGRPATEADLSNVKRLMDAGAHVKFAAPYEFSRDGGPRFEDVEHIARTLVAHRPDRIVWGSNWPHILNAPSDKPDDEALAASILPWIDKSDQEAVFVTNPKQLFSGK